MNSWKLRFSMVGTLALIFGLSTLVFVVILTLSGISLNIVTIGLLVVGFNVVQWLISPYLVGAIYRVKEMPHDENPRLHQMVETLSLKSKIKKPKLMLSQIPLPNAFAYGSPLTGNRVAVTQGLLKSLDEGEVEAVIGTSLTPYRDVQVMMVVSFCQPYSITSATLLCCRACSATGAQQRRSYNALIAYCLWRSLGC